MLTPQPGLPARRLQAARADNLKPQVADAAVATLPARVRAMSGNG